MTVIASNPQYRILVDTNKNRLFISAKGMWLDKAEFSNFIDDIKAALDQLSPNLSILIDASEMKGAILPEIFGEAQMLGMQKG